MLKNIGNFSAMLLVSSLMTLAAPALAGSSHGGNWGSKPHGGHHQNHGGHGKPGWGGHHGGSIVSAPEIGPAGAAQALALVLAALALIASNRRRQI